MTQAVVFPGQGSQKAGMGLDFAAEQAEAQEVFDLAGEVLPFDVEALIREGDEQLDLTAYTQPCILAAEVAMLRALEGRYGLAPELFGGHSLGEYSALVAAGAMPLREALELVHIRGKLMQQAVSAGEGMMAALLARRDFPREEIVELARRNHVDVANDNSEQQLVVSGMKPEVEAFLNELEPLREAGLKVIPLTVSAPFHSRHMAEIEESFRQELERVQHCLEPEKATRVLSNFLGGFHTGERAALIDALTHQISGTVKWRDNMAALLERTTDIVEVGPNRPLRGFFRAAGERIEAVVSVATAEKVLG